MMSSYVCQVSDDPHQSDRHWGLVVQRLAARGDCDWRQERSRTRTRRAEAVSAHLSCWSQTTRLVVVHCTGLAGQLGGNKLDSSIRFKADMSAHLA